MDREFEVEIDGALFKVKQVLYEDDSANYGEKEAELVARACLLYEEETEKHEISRKVEKVTKENVTEVTETVKEVFKEKLTEKSAEEKLDRIRESTAEVPSASLNYRRQIEELSRYLSRDSRRYDGNFDMY